MGLRDGEGWEEVDLLRSSKEELKQKRAHIQNLYILECVKDVRNTSKAITCTVSRW